MSQLATPCCTGCQPLGRSAALDCCAMPAAWLPAAAFTVPVPQLVRSVHKFQLESPAITQSNFFTPIASHFMSHVQLAVCVQAWWRSRLRPPWRCLALIAAASLSACCACHSVYSPPVSMTTFGSLRAAAVAAW
uniref:Uncharacterized protein n=1 Tax=Chlamydomonas leiostraca TaxID=1034604 RepID=A0A7S0S6P8_9CHLO